MIASPERDNKRKRSPKKESPRPAKKQKAEAITSSSLPKETSILESGSPTMARASAGKPIISKWNMSDSNEQLQYDFKFNNDVIIHFNAMDTIQPCPDADDDYRATAIRTFLGIMKKHVASRLFMESHPVIRQSWEYLEEGDRLQMYLARDSDFMTTYTKICQTFAEKESPKKNHTRLSDLVVSSKSPQKKPVKRRNPPKRTIHTRKKGLLSRYPRRKRR